MKEKEIKILTISNLLISMGLIFLPIDYIYVHIIELILLLIDIPLIISNYFFNKKKKVFLYLIIIEIATFTFFIILIVKKISYFTVYWKLNLILCFISKTILVSKSLKINKQNKYFIFIFICSIISVKILFFPLYYYFDGNTNDMEDIRSLDLDECYRIIGRHKFKRKNVKTLPLEKIDIISDILLNSTWMSEHYSDYKINSSLLKSENIANNIKYDFS